ncbi:hypothetical protein BH11PSE8_BH11PSE8_40930 [soil metagenome]
MNPAVSRYFAGTRVALGLAACFTSLMAIAPAFAADDFSPAEKALFMENQLAKLRPPMALHYSFRKSGSMEENFDDKIDVALTPQADGSCCTATPQFFTGARQVRQPEVEVTQGNPVILYFLERDIREMERLTKGKSNYFRKRIRMAVYQGATIRDLTLPYRGKPVAVREIAISPYLDDPNRPRYDKLAVKQYQFLMSDAVPGGLYGIRTRIGAAAADAPPLIAEDMLIDGAAPASALPPPMPSLLPSPLPATSPTPTPGKPS